MSVYQLVFPVDGPLLKISTGPPARDAFLSPSSQHAFITDIIIGSMSGHISLLSRDGAMWLSGRRRGTALDRVSRP